MFVNFDRKIYVWYLFEIKCIKVERNMFLVKFRLLFICYIEVVNGKRVFGLIFELVKMYFMYFNVLVMLFFVFEC